MEIKEELSVGFLREKESELENESDRHLMCS